MTKRTRRVTAGSATLFVVVIAAFWIHPERVDTSWKQPVVALPDTVEPRWGPNRPQYATDGRPDFGALNSLENGTLMPDGEEGLFFWIESLDDPESNLTTSITLRPGQKYRGWIYFHNAAQPNAGGNSVATNARARLEMPASVLGRTTANATISAKNVRGAPEVWSSVVFSSVTSDGAVTPRLIPQSVRLTGYGAMAGARLAELDLLDEGVILGCDRLDGRLSGARKCSGAVRFDFVADNADFELLTHLRKNSSDNWNYKAIAQPGQRVSILMTYRNVGSVQQDDVVLRADIPRMIRFVRGSTTLTVSKHPRGVRISDNIPGRGVNIGSYAPGGVAYVKFQVQIPSDTAVRCGQTYEPIPVSAETDNGTKRDSAYLFIERECP